MTGTPAAEVVPETPPAEPIKPDEAPKEPEAPKDPTFSQSDIDRAVSKALNTREKAIVEENKEKTLKENKDFAALSEIKDAKIKTLEENAARSAYIAENDLGEFRAVLNNVPIEGLDAASVALKAAVNASSLKQVAEQLKTPTPPPGEQVPEKSISEMTTEEYKAYKKTKGVAY